MTRRTALFLIFSLVGVLCVLAQLPPAAPPVGPAKPQPGALAPPGKESTPSSIPEPSLNVPIFQFRLRAAFMLTPMMVAAIQSTSLNTQNSKSGQGTSSSEKSENPDWQSPIQREVNLASTLGVKIQGDQLIAMIVFVPLELVKTNLTMLVQNQIYVKSPDNSIQMNTLVHTIRVPLGVLFYYYPLGGDSKQGAPVAIEMLINQK